MWGNSWKKIFMGLLGLLIFGSVSAAGLMLADGETDSANTDKSFSEYLHIYKAKKLTSTYPIEIKKKGRSLLVTSDHSQMLPVYKDNGVFYGLFRLNKGTNWISGLPRGTYVINNSKFTLS